MKLHEYISESGESLNALAKRAGVTPSTLYRYASGEHKSINREIAKEIVRATGGKVTFLELVDPNGKYDVKVVPK